MKELEKILAEIETEFDRRIGTQLQIMGGLGDDVYRYGYGKSLEAYQQGKLFVQDIIQKHMNGDTPSEIQELKERDTAKPPIDIEDNYGFFVCPSCGNSIYASDDFESHKFCLNCGQRILWKEDIDGK